MDLDILTVTALIVLGASTGFLAGLLGIGGGYVDGALYDYAFFCQRC